MNYRTLIIGLGQIGMGYDLKLEADKYILSHARAFDCHSGFELVAGVDPDNSRCQAFIDEYKRPAYDQIATAIAEHKPEVVVVACPTEFHASVVDEVFQHLSPKVLLCEKPIAYDLDDAQRILGLCSEKGTHLFVNYMRRSDPGVLEISRRIQNGEISQPIKGVVWYSKGLFNNGSHFINLLQGLIGNPVSCTINAKGRLWDGLDPEPDLNIRYENGDVTFLAAREEDFSHYTIELITGNGRLRYEQGGADIRWQPVINDPVCDGYTILDPIGYDIQSDFDKAQWNVVNQLHLAMQGKEASISNGEDAYITLEFLSHIKSRL